MSITTRLKRLETRVRGRRRLVLCEVDGVIWQPEDRNYWSGIHDYDADGHVCAPPDAKILSAAQITNAYRLYDVWLMKWVVYDGNARDAEPTL